MTEYAWPAALRPSRLSFYLQHNTLRFVSPVSRATQVLRRDGARWIAEASFDPLNPIQAGMLEGLLAALAGSANTVRIWDWRREYRTGDPRSQGEVPSGPYSFSDATIFTDGTGMVVGSGTPSLSAGAARGALSLQTQGWWPNAVAVGAGDHIGLAGRLYMATETVTASGTGTATIPIAPPLRAAAAMNVRENIAGDALASITTLLWNVPSKAWTGGAAMADASLNKRMTVRLGPAVAFAQIGIVGFDGQIEVEALRLYGLPEAAPALLCGTPTLPVGQREFAAEVAWDLPSLAPGATSLLDVAVAGARQGDLAQAALTSSTRFIELDATAWSNNTVRVMARNISPATFDLGAATLSVAARKRRVP